MLAYDYARVGVETSDCSLRRVAHSHSSSLQQPVEGQKSLELGPTRD